MRDDSLTIWTITHRPVDLPGVEYAARRHRILAGEVQVHTGPPLTAPSLEEIRALLPPGLHRIERSPEDDPVIVESWI
jgi:hypothetical protein